MRTFWKDPSKRFFNSVGLSADSTEGTEGVSLEHKYSREGSEWKRSLLIVR